MGPGRDGGGGWNSERRRLEQSWGGGRKRKRRLEQREEPGAAGSPGCGENLASSLKAVVLGAAPGATGSVQGGGQPEEPDPACV